jgi:hypothetical protein
MEILLSVCLGIGLSAACGFRVFVPLLVMSVASISGHLDLSSGFGWIGTYPALVAFAVATAVEVAGYYIPWVDNALDTVATPIAVVAGIVVAASCITGMSPLLRWTLAIVAGGGVAGAVQGLTATTRVAATAATGGFGNPLVATAEAGGAVALSILAIALPLAVGAGVLVALIVLAKRIRRRCTPLPTGSSDERYPGSGRRGAS